MALNVTTAVFGEGCNTATASPSLAQWDQGQVLKIEGVDLPSAYQVEFSTEYTRNAIPRIGNADGVAIPNELLQRSAPITAYIVLHEGESDRETEYWITIHITSRTPPETVTPDPQQMDVIDETIEALQDGVAAAEAAAQSVQNMGVEAETLTPGSPLTVTKEVDPETGAVTLIFGLTQGPKGDNGYSPTITITTITGGHRFTVTDKTHPSGQSFDVLDGAKGDPGDEGYSPVVTITTITGGHRFTVTDKTHPSGQSFDVLDGAKGDPGDEGYSPVVTITTITGGHRVTITDKTHPSGQTFDVMDGVIQSVNGKSATSITLDAGDIEFDDSETYQNGSTGAKLSALKNALNTLYEKVNDPVHGLAQKAPLIINNASGDIASFPDGADNMPIKSLVAAIEPVQDLNGQDAPYPAGGGRQLLNPATFDTFPKTVSGVTCTLNPDGSISLSGTATANDVIAIISYKRLQDYGVFSAGVSYRLSGFVSSSVYCLFGVYGSGTDYRASTASGVVMSFTEEQIETLTYRLLIYFANGTNTNGMVIKPMICLDSALNPTVFAPYENICPISGHDGLTVARTGKNLFDKTAFTKYGWALWTPNPFRKLPVGQTVSFSINKIDSESHGFAITVNTAVGGTAVATLAGYGFGNEIFTATSPITQAIKDAPYLQLNGNWNGLTADMVSNAHFQIEFGAASSYEPYTGTTISVTWQTEAGTVYGGYIDVIDGKIVITKAAVDLGSLSWFYQTSRQMFQNNLIGAADSPLGVICSRYKTIPSQYDKSDNTIGLTQWSYLTGQINVVDHSFNGDTVAFKTAMNGVIAVYELATPIEYTIDGEELTTLYGQNNVWTDVGDVSVDYPADTKLYIDNKITTAIANALNS